MKEVELVNFLFLLRLFFHFRNPAFIYDINKTKTETFSQIPALTYLTWKELEELLYTRQRTFDRFYALEIVEKLPDGRYKKNKVPLAKPSAETTY